MRRRIAPATLVAVAAVAAGLAAAEPPFSQALRPEDFAAAGLTKLSLAELARLDTLVRDHRAGVNDRGRVEPAAVPSARDTVAARMPAPAESAERGGSVQKARVLLAPGTQVEYATIESRIAGDFRGWEPRTVFVLENGQRWQVAGGDSYVLPRPIATPAVKIAPGMLGTFWLTVEGVKPRVKVARVGGGR